MSKNLFFKVLVALLFVAAAVMWLLSVLDVIDFPLAWMISVFCGALGLLFLVKGLVQKNIGVVKKLNVLFGCALLVAAALALVGTLLPEAIVWPIVAIGITAAVLLCILAVGGKKWDQGDNQNVGYKNYYQRKEEERKKEEEENK